ncbi:MAG: choice-of-anchor I family protein, partial [Gammaproteobacteria bacterium SHHR-1]
LLEHGIANAGETSGRFPQVSGLSFSYDASQAEGSKIQSLAITDAQGQIEQLLFAEGDFVLPAESPINLVTLNFLADGDGDGYPFAANQQGDLVPLYDPEADASFSTPGYEQQAFYDYLQTFHATAASAYNQVETSAQQDSRIQSLASRSDGLDAATPELSLLGRYETGLFDQSAAEITAYDADSGYLLTVNALAAQVDLLSLQQLAADAGAAQIKIGSVDLSSYGAGVNSVAVHNGLAAVAVEAQEKTDNGSVVLFRLADIGSDGSLNSANIKQLSVGALPDMLTFSADGSQLLVANEGEPNDDYSIDPLGSVSVIDMSVGFDNLSQAQVTTLDFSAFNDQQDALQAEGVRIFGRDATVARDLEPEYIALSADGSEAIVGLQENNAIARIDLSGTPRILDIIPLGLKDHSLPGNELDSSDKDQGIDIANAPVLGMYQPDAVVGFSVAGTDYYLFANEGDSRDYDGFSEEARVKDLTLDPTRFADAASLQADDQLGRLQVSTEGGADSDGDGDIDQLLAYGGRSISIRSADGELVWDSGSLIEQAVAQYLPEYFNASNDDNELDSRSDNKGPEPEGLAVGQIGDQLFAFVGLERVSGVMTFNISDPANPYLVGYSNHRDFSADVETAAAGDLGPEGLTFIDALDSPSGQPLLVVANEVSGSISLYQISAPSNQARFDAASGQLILPELSLNSALADSYQARFNLVNSSQTIQLQLDLTSLSAVENNPLLANAVFSNGRLDIPQVEILGQHYAVELQLIGDNYLFELSSFSLL